jgi:Fic family protein
MSTLHRSYSNVSARSGGIGNTTSCHNTSTNAYTENYMSVLKSFQAAQMDRQKASLTCNSGRESAATAQKNTQQHQRALEYLWNLPPGEDLTWAHLNFCHRTLCSGLVEDAGTLRRTNVRVGCASFCPHERGASMLLQLLETIRTLRSRLIQHVSSKDETAEAAITFCAVVFMGIIDTYPYSDGNGRLARIAVN